MRFEMKVDEKPVSAPQDEPSGCTAMRPAAVLIHLSLATIALDIRPPQKAQATAPEQQTLIVTAKPHTNLINRYVVNFREDDMGADAECDRRLG